jgi:hypothetical protein
VVERGKADDQGVVDDAAKWRGVCDEIAAAHAHGATVVVTAHFHSTLTALEAALRDCVIAFAPSSSLELSWFNQSLAGPTVLVVQSQNSRLRLGNASRSDVARIVFVVVECYPTPERDETLLKTVVSLGSGCEVVYHLALSDPLLKEFNTDKIQTLLPRLALANMRPCRVRSSPPPFAMRKSRSRRRFPAKYRRALPRSGSKRISHADTSRHRLCQNDRLGRAMRIEPSDSVIVTRLLSAYHGL